MIDLTYRELFEEAYSVLIPEIYVTGIRDLIKLRNQKVFKEIIYNNIKILIVIAFIVNFYTFSFVVELFLISILTCIVFYNVSHRRDGKKTCVFYLMNGLLIIIIIFILFLFVSNVVSDYKSFVNLDTLIKFLLPPVLTFLFLPFIYFFVYICKN